MNENNCAVCGTHVIYADLHRHEPTKTWLCEKCVKIYKKFGELFPDELHLGCKHWPNCDTAGCGE